MSTRLDRLQLGLTLALAGVAPLVCWTYGSPPRGTQDVLALRFTSGPSPGLRRGAQGDILLPADSVVLHVTGDTAPRRTIVRLNGFAYQVDVAAPDDVTSIRDDLIEQINAGEAGAVVATEDHSSFPDLNDAILLTAEFIGGLRSLSLSGEITSDAPVFSGDAVLVTEATVRGLVTMTAYSSEREPRNGAPAIIDAAFDALRTEASAELLARYGVGLWGWGSANDISAIAGADWETRAALDVVVAARSVFVSPVEQIETVTQVFTVDVDGDGDVDATFEVETDAPA